MEYTTEALNRATGDLELRRLGDWLTVTEFGEHHGVDARRIRAILREIGLLQPEGHHGRYRLTLEAVAKGYGKRIDRPKKGKYPFDVLSPAGQAYAVANWDRAVRQLEDAVGRCEKSVRARAALDSFASLRKHPMTTQEKVRWLRQHYPSLSKRRIALILGVSEQLVGRYAEQLARQRANARKESQRVFKPLNPDEVEAGLDASRTLYRSLFGAEHEQPPGGALDTACALLTKAALSGIKADGVSEPDNF